MDELTVERSLAKTKKRRRFWRLRRHKEASPAANQLPEAEEEDHWSSTSDGRGSSADGVTVLTDPSLVAGSCEQLASAAEEEEEKAEKVSLLALLYDKATVLLH